MKLVEKKCPNCGASIKFNDDDKETVCNYCHTSFDIEKDPAEKLMDSFNLHAKTIRTVSKGVFITTAIIFIFILITFIILVVTQLKSRF